MRTLAVYFLSTLIGLVAACTGMSAEPQAPFTPTGPQRYDVERCRQSVDAAFAGRLTSPSHSVSALCNVDGSMTVCRGPTHLRSTIRPPSAFEEDRQHMLAACLGDP